MNTDSAPIQIRLSFLRLPKSVKIRAIGVSSLFPLSVSISGSSVVEFHPSVFLCFLLFNAFKNPEIISLVRGLKPTSPGSDQVYRKDNE
jgi:hypothetical protein